MSDCVFQIGDLVQFDSYGDTIGVVIDIRESPNFIAPDRVYDILVSWSDGEEFWCLDFALVLISKYKTI
tara:strand:+ start:583 stop:789 length:207 start_codon:yes stop_codon:yes gene_type:complete